MMQDWMYFVRGENYANDLFDNSKSLNGDDDTILSYGEKCDDGFQLAELFWHGGDRKGFCTPHHVIIEFISLVLLRKASVNLPTVQRPVRLFSDDFNKRFSIRRLLCRSRVLYPCQSEGFSNGRQIER